MRPKTCGPDAYELACAPAYEPSPQERSALETYLQSAADSAPRMTVRDDAATTIAPDHLDPAVGQVLLMAALGTTDRDFFGGVVRQLGDASSPASGRGSRKAVGPTFGCTGNCSKVQSQSADGTCRSRVNQRQRRCPPRAGISKFNSNAC